MKKLIALCIVSGCFFGFIQAQQPEKGKSAQAHAKNEVRKDTKASEKQEKQEKKAKKTKKVKKDKKVENATKKENNAQSKAEKE